MKCRTLFLLSAVAFCLTEALVAQPRAWAPVVRAGDRLASAPVVLSQFCAFQPGLDSKVREKVREKGQYVLELEGTGARGRVQVFFRRVDKLEADYRASPAVGDLTCSVNQIMEPNDRPRTLNELGFRANAAAKVQVLGPSILLQIRAMDPPPPGGDGVRQCIMKVTLRAGK